MNRMRKVPVVLSVVILATVVSRAYSGSKHHGSASKQAAAADAQRAQVNAEMAADLVNVKTSAAALTSELVLARQNTSREAILNKLESVDLPAIKELFDVDF